MYHQYVSAPKNFPKSFIYITSDDIGVTSLCFVNEKDQAEIKSQFTEQCANQVKEYFNHKRKIFTVPLNPIGTEFQKKVWQELIKIPYGEYWSYKQLSLALGSANYCRAVGMANSRNPIALLIPCHRVIGHNNKLVGYTGGINIKSWLLKHEAEVNSNFFEMK